MAADVDSKRANLIPVPLSGSSSKFYYELLELGALAQYRTGAWVLSWYLKYLREP